jgi:hypothetical protein
VEYPRFPEQAGEAKPVDAAHNQARLIGFIVIASPGGGFHRLAYEAPLEKGIKHLLFRS